MVAALAVTGALIVGLVQVVTVVVARQQAQSAADAAALAGVSGGPDIAAEIAARNHALLVSSQWEGDDLVVVVAVEATVGPWRRSVGAVARATRAP